MRIFDRLLTVLAAAEHRDVVHRAWPIERVEGDDVLEPRRLHRRQRPAHAFGFDLEHADRVAALKQVVHGRVVPRQRAEIDLHALFGEQTPALFQYRQRLEAEEVELHQPRRLDIFHVELSHRHVRPRVAVERNQLVERAVADDHAGGVGRSVARQPLELHRQVEQPPDLGSFLYSAASSETPLSDRSRVQGSVG